MVNAGTGRAVVGVVIDSKPTPVGLCIGIDRVTGPPLWFVTAGVQVLECVLRRLDDVAS